MQLRPLKLQERDSKGGSPHGGVPMHIWASELIVCFSVFAGSGGGTSGRHQSPALGLRFANT